jgi:hypothetical protein
MEYDAVCNRLCDDISQLLLGGTIPPTKRAAFAAGRATQDLSAAFHHAAGRPEDRLWSTAIESLEHFLDICVDSSVGNSAEQLELQAFLAENVDLLSPRLELKLAS